MNVTKLSLIALVAALGAAPAAASADSLVTAAPGARNLTSGGGLLAWSMPAPGGGYKVVLRAPDGTVSTPDLPRFRVAPRVQIGSDGFAAAGRRLVLTYARGGDVFTFDVAAGTEKKVRGASSSSYEEYSPSVSYGRFVFARRGGRNNGVFYLRDGRLSKLTNARPREVVTNGSRAAYTSAKNVVVRRLSGRGSADTIRVPGDGQAFGLVLTRYAVTFATRGGKLFQSDPFGGSGRSHTASGANAASETLPTSTNSFAFSRQFVRYYADAEGVKTLGTQNIFKR